MAQTQSQTSRVTLTVITTVLDVVAVLLGFAALAVLTVELPLVGGLVGAAVLVLSLSWAITRTQPGVDR